MAFLKWGRLVWKWIMGKEYLKDLIYESTDGGKTIRIRRSVSWDKTKYSEHQLVDLLDLLYASKTDNELRTLLDRAFVYWYLKQK